MSELVGNPEREQAHEIITEGLERWLANEAGSSTVSHNKILDDFKRFRSNLALPYEDSKNINAGKNRSHHNRLTQWTNGFLRHYLDFDAVQKDYALARQIFCAQMYLSGLFRVQCLMQARDQEDYYDKRLNGTYSGVDLDSIIDWRLHELFGATPDSEKLQSPKITLIELTDQTLIINERQREYSQNLHRTGCFDIGKTTSPTVDSIFVLQRDWTSHIADYIAFAAAERGGQLAAVPFLEPKSISDDPKVYRPFKAVSS